jgi:virulence-associated protein VapD
MISTTPREVFTSRKKNDMANLYRAIEALKKIDWFKKSVRDLRAFRVEDWSDFTSVIKEG